MQAPLQARNESEAAQTDTARTVAQTRVLADNRPEAVVQRKLAEIISNSPRVLQQRALSDAIHNSSRMVAQRHQMTALFGGTGQPQGNGAMRTEASLAQREEKTNKTGLPNQLKSGIESLSGMSMDHVKVHYNSDKPAQLQANAYAQGSEIHLGAGQERHLPHEAWHVVQQAQGRVRPNLHMKAGAVNDDPLLEREAGILGEKAARFKGDNVERSRVADAERIFDKKRTRQLSALHEPVAQLIKGYGTKQNRYREVEIANHAETDLDKLSETEKTLIVVKHNEVIEENVRHSEETGYQVLRLEADEEQVHWQIAAEVLHWTGLRTLATLNSFTLPVSCIDAAEHVIQSFIPGKKIPNFDRGNPQVNNVSLHLHNPATNVNEAVVNISDDEIPALNNFGSFNFDAAAVQLGEGLLAINPANPGESLHAVVVVGKNVTNGQIIVLERNAGLTTGSNMYADANWLANVYASPDKFRASLSEDHIVGKLVRNA